MSWRTVMLVMMVLGGTRAFASGIFPPPGMSLPDYWGEENVWWEGRASFHGQVIVPACALAMEDAWQVVDMGVTPVRDLQNAYAGPEKRFQLRLRDCELAGTGKRVFTGSRIRVTFDGVEGETPDKFSTAGQARGVNLQIVDGQGYTARSGKVMPAQVLEGNEQGLDYTLRVVRNSEPLKAGDYSASLRFKVDYE
ncbi:fimbrial protein [Salmonella enterica]|nr:fimbrial protein [Salmonella enterica]EGM2029587.1 type 1 fimbrial protein [Salmonella enterica]ELV2721367.1 type 1 fimbrial protein [Salmonella enterica]HDN6545879.1 type 1 fimbrial protein [Salmonella enterica subsp. enterica serovar Chester]